MKNKKKSEAMVLRQKAEEELAGRIIQTEPGYLNTDIHQLIHELQVHQVELTMQNDELSKANEGSEFARKQYADLYDFAPSGYFTLNSEGEILQLNLCASKMVGKERALLVHNRLGFFISDDTKSYFNNFLQNTFKYNCAEYCEVTFLVKGRDPMYVQLNGSLAEDESRCLITAVNITERKKAEMAIIESERFLKETQLIGRLGSFSIDIARGIWIGSDVLNMIFGVDDHYDKTLSGWMSIVHPDWRIIVRDAFYESVGFQTKFDLEYKIVRQDDLTERWMHVLGRIELDEVNTPLSVKGTILDITEQKLAKEAIRISEEKYRMLLELASDAFFQGDRNGNFITVNTIATEYTGYNREELLQMNMKNLFSEHTMQISPLKYSEARSGEIVLAERELIRKDGTTMLVEMKSKMMPDGTYQSFFRDITEKKRVENALKQKLHEMEIYYELAVTRERKMITLKSEVNQLLTRLGENVKY